MFSATDGRWSPTVLCRPLVFSLCLPGFCSSVIYPPNILKASTLQSSNFHLHCVSEVLLYTYFILPHYTAAATAAAKSHQSCLTLCNSTDSSPPGSPIPGILQARTLEWVAISFSNAWKWKVKVKSLSRFRPFATPWTAAYQAPLSMGFSRQEYWSGVPLPSLPHYTRFQKISLARKPGQLQC